jgi:aryl-alcohol dehydrogenase-like predicted oxidoreductase
MEYVRRGASGLKVSPICLGMMSYGDPGGRAWMLSEEHAEPIVRRAIEAGVTFFDTADMYSDGLSERITGRLLKKLFPRREAYVLSTRRTSRWGPDRTIEVLRGRTYSRRSKRRCSSPKPIRVNY